MTTPKETDDTREKFRKAIMQAADRCHDATQWNQEYWIAEVGQLPIDALLDELMVIHRLGK